ncbi:MAG: M20/M25/M40 family metallo-hydrolase [Propionibacteriaceae bacterium]|jgi:acetylornithine deacetylase/succinyl-diaminopimelate desuccinylase-like protein|nr:M20/M25/M40 family metallo-hydrolase [Propionibacteriaceae bacterium]
MVAAEDEVVGFLSDLIRIDTQNPGPGLAGPGERVAADYVAEKLGDVGIECEVYEAAPRRTTLVARWEPDGVDRTLPPLLLHGHTDVVPAVAADWTVPPLSGAVEDGCVWGRGAIDMKDFDAMLLAVVRQRVREGRPPRRPIRLVFTADEECGGVLGAVPLVRQHPETVADCRQAVGEVGGFSVTADAARLYLVQTAEKGLAWLKLIAEGPAGHGSMRHADNAVTELAAAVARLGAHRFPQRLHPAQAAFLDAAGAALGVEITADNVEETLARLGSIARMVAATMSHTVNPTMLDAGYKVNVVPGRATAQVDGRYLPGRRDEFIAAVTEVIGPKVRLEILHEQTSVEADLASALVGAMRTSIERHDPGAQVVPYLLSAGTDAKAWTELGIECYGFVPLRLPADLDFTGLFHGVDERVPIESLQFGVRVLDEFLDLA